MSSNDNNPQQAKGIVDNIGTRVRDGVINNESQIINSHQQKSDENILFASQQQQFYHHPPQGGPPQQYTMYPSGVTYSIDPTQSGTNHQVGGIDYTMLQPQQIYQLPVYYSSETFHPQQGYEDPYQTSTSTQFQSIIGGTPAGGGAAPPHQQYHIQTAQYSGAGAEQQQNYMQQQQENSQGIIYPKVAGNATLFDNTAAKYTEDWVSRTTLIPSEMKVPPDQATIDLISHDSKVITPKNWGEGSYVVTTSSTKPIASATDQQQPLLDQQLAQLDINTFPFVSSHLSQPQQQLQQLQGGLGGGGGYALNWPGTSQQPQQQQQMYRDQNIRGYNATGAPQKTQATSWADITKRGTNNNNIINNGPPQHHQQQRPQFGGGGNNFHQDQQRGSQSAQPVIIHSQIRHERSFTGPKNILIKPVQIILDHLSGMPRTNNNMGRGTGGGPPRQYSQNLSSFSAPPQRQQQRGPPLPSLLAQHRTQNFPRNNFGAGGHHQQQQQRGQQGNNFGFTNFGGDLQQPQHHQQMPEFNPGVPPPSLPSQFRQQQQPMPPMMPPPPFPPPPFNMMNPQQQQQFFRAFISQVRPDAMMPPPGPYGFDQFGQRFFNPGYPFGPPSIPPYGGQFNRYPNFNARGQRRGGGGRGSNRFQQPRRNFQDQSTKYYSNNTQNNQQSSNQDSSIDTKSAPLDSELADSVNRGVEFDRDETKTPEPKGDTETTGSPNDENKKDLSPKEEDEEEEDLDVKENVDGEISSPPKNTTTLET
uniref:Enamelin n=1 Tax=Panagrolaimus superbus TaxID=310955 RepID=A0A914Y7J7_9BILA